MHALPRDTALRQDWMNFIFFNKVPENVSQHLRLCTAHFSPDCIENQARYNAGFVSKLLLTPGAVPTVLNPASDIQQQVLGIPEDSRTNNKRVCGIHFTPDCFENYREVQMGFCVNLRLTNVAVPSPAEGPSTKIFREVACQTEKDVECKTEPSDNHAQCQTCPVVTANGMPSRRSQATSTPGKRPRHDVPDESSDHPDVTDSTINGDGTSMETPPHKMRKFIVYEDKLMQLFQRCPACNGSCVVTTTTMGTLLLVEQGCPHCEHSRKWSSQPFVNKFPAGNLQLAQAVHFTGSSFMKIQKFMKAFNIPCICRATYRKLQRFLLPTINWQWTREQSELSESTNASVEVVLSEDES
ncbi:hypothetical protein SKAU_G00189220 [Synaphobranchus kaupii]|uniref:THAP-type domain-containing protein n=1 Tax=Synaphobranchus kaupii TaxID=118154 RepID=A0A9Q1FDQ6_SYNKA|nr:hypothetical protein SKAU_G00189220 [Synaphobranchus kaupii]